MILASLLAAAGTTAWAAARKPSLEEARAMADQCRPQSVAVEQAWAGVLACYFSARGLIDSPLTQGEATNKGMRSGASARVL